MGIVKRVGKFGAGGVAGGLIGAAVGLLFAPGSGEEFRTSVRGRMSATRLAGADAQFEKEQELIQRFRGGVDSKTALHDEETKASVVHKEKIALINQV